jgi:peptidoglycan/LPS O-acetylase OafA/YrhL
MVGFGTTVFLLGGYHLLGEPVLCFFSGGLAYLIWVRSDWPREYVALASTAALAASGIYLSHNWQWHSHFVLGVGLVLYPALVLLLATLQRWNAELGRNTRVIGDITYSTYLLHFPLQLMLILLVQSEILQIDFADEAAWVSFLALVIALGIPTYYRFERPAQNALRKLLLRGFGPQLSEPVKTSSPS